VTEASLEVAERLAEYARMTRAAMDTWLAGREPVAYLYDLVRDYPSRGGKGLRPALLLATCEAFGRSAAVGLSSAVALEMLHNAFLVHDDIEDESVFRRGGPTLQQLHGVALAVNAGDSLASLALRPLLSDRGLGYPLAHRVLIEVLTAIQKTTEGQATDLGWRRHRVVDLRAEDYVELAGKKAGWYTTVAPLRIGALIGAQPVARLHSISRFGFYLGVAFQIRDDLMDLGAGLNSGKEAFRDIREGKRTLMLTHLLCHARDADREWLMSYLDDSDCNGRQSDIARVLELFELYGSIEFAREYARGIEAATYAAFDSAFALVPASPHLSFIRGLIGYVVSRTC
jgi:geranylgeranyl diphosphate synthase type II